MPETKPANTPAEKGLNRGLHFQALDWAAYEFLLLWALFDNTNGLLYVFTEATAHSKDQFGNRSIQFRRVGRLIDYCDLTSG